jgi:hypothetical protein
MPKKEATPKQQPEIFAVDTVPPWFPEPFSRCRGLVQVPPISKPAPPGGMSAGFKNFRAAFKRKQNSSDCCR